MMRRAIIPAIAALGCLAAPAALHAQNNAIEQGLMNEGWTSVRGMPEADVSWFQGLIDNTNWNLSAYPECTRVAAAADAMLANSNELWYWGDLTGVYAMHKEYVTNMGGVHAVIFNRRELNGKDALSLETFLEEAAHHAADPPTIDPVTGDTLAVDTAFVMHSYESAAGPTDFRADFATDCGKLKKKEDEDDDGPGGNTGTTETCTETLEWVPPETDEEFVKPEPSTTEGGGTLPGPPGVTPTPLPPVVVGFDSGKWVDVVIKKGYWKTVKECTLN